MSSMDAFLKRQEVLDLLVRYCRVMDDRQLDLLPDLFHENCTFTLRDGATFVSGREASAALTRIAAGAQRHRHVLTNVEIAVDGDSASARSDWYLVGPDEGESWLIEDVGLYDDVVQNFGGQWKFVSRVISRAPR